MWAQLSRVITLLSFLSSYSFIWREQAWLWSAWFERRCCWRKYFTWSFEGRERWRLFQSKSRLEISAGHWPVKFSVCPANIVAYRTRMTGKFCFQKKCVSELFFFFSGKCWRLLLEQSLVECIPFHIPFCISIHVPIRIPFHILFCFPIRIPFHILIRIPFHIPICIPFHIPFRIPFRFPIRIVMQTLNGCRRFIREKRKSRSLKPCKYCALSFKWNVCNSNYTFARYHHGTPNTKYSIHACSVPANEAIAKKRSANSVQWETWARLHENDHFVQNVNWPTHAKMPQTCYSLLQITGLIQVWYHSCIRLLSSTDCSELTVSDQSVGLSGLYQSDVTEWYRYVGNRL